MDIFSFYFSILVFILVLHFLQLKFKDGELSSHFCLKRGLRLLSRSCFQCDSFGKSFLSKLLHNNNFDSFCLSNYNHYVKHDQTILSYHCDVIFAFHIKWFKLSSLRLSILHIRQIKLYTWHICQIESNS